MRVLYVSKASHVAGHRSKLAALSERVELTLVVPERWGRAPVEEGNEGSYRTVRLPAVLHGHNHFHFYRHLDGVLRSGAFDLVHVDEEPYSLVCVQVVRRAYGTGTPSLFFAWQNIDKRLPPPFGTLRADVFRRVRGGIAGNAEAAEVLRRRGYLGPLAVIPQMGVDPDVFRPDEKARRKVRHELHLADGDFLVGYLGRLVPEKGVDLILDAAARLPGSHALVVGDGPERERLGRRAESSDLKGRIHFVGNVPSLEAPRWIAALDCLALPSRTTAGWKEQFGRVLIEAMACGVPVVGSSSGEIPSVIGDAGRVVSEGDSGALLGALRILSEDVELRLALGTRGRARVLAHFTQKQVVGQTLDFYRTLVGDPASVPRQAMKAS